jgi:hypothetical protein
VSAFNPEKHGGESALPIGWVIGDFELPMFGALVREGNSAYYDVPWEKPWDIPTTGFDYAFKKRYIFDGHTILLGKGNIAEMVAAQKRIGISRSVITVVNDRYVLELGDFARGDDLMNIALEALTSHPNRFEVFSSIDYEGFTSPGWTDREIRRFNQLWEQGVRGIKGHMGSSMVIRGFNAVLGLPKHHSFLTDPKVELLWQRAGELGAIVFQHLGDAPVNEKWYPFDKIFAEYEEMVSAHPDTLFVVPHLMGSTDNMDRVRQWLARYPNLYCTMSGLVTVLRPTTAFTAEGAESFRGFVTEHEDRIIFGTDAGMGRQYNTEAIYYVYRRWLEDPLGSSFEMDFGEWKRVYALGLPDDTLEKLYHGNLERLFSRQRR